MTSTFCGTTWRRAAPRHPRTGRPVAQAWFARWQPLDKAAAIVREAAKAGWTVHVTPANRTNYVHLHIYR